MDPYGIVPFKIIQNQAAGALLSQTRIIVGTLLEILFYYRPPRYHLWSSFISATSSIFTGPETGLHPMNCLASMWGCCYRVEFGAVEPNFWGPRIHGSRKGHVSTIKADISGPRSKVPKVPCITSCSAFLGNCHG